MRKKIAILLACMMLVIMIAACANEEPTLIEPTPPSAVEEPTQESEIEPEPEPEPEPEQPPEPEHEHDWQEANFQMPRACLVCGETDGEPLQAQFPLSGFTLSEIGVTYPYVSVTHGRPDLPTIGEVMVTEAARMKGNERLEVRDGYEWIIAIVRMDFSDNNAQSFGYRTLVSPTLNYYGFDLSVEPGHIEDGFSTFAINFLGEDYDVQMHSETLTSGWHSVMDNIATDISMYSFHVPIGYDGILLGISNAAHNPGLFDIGYDRTVTFSDLFDSDTLFFRLSDEVLASVDEMELFELVNAERERFGLEPLLWSNGLAYLARQYCIDMSDMGVREQAEINMLMNSMLQGLTHIFPFRTSTFLESHSTATEFFESQNWIQLVGANTHIGIGNHGDYWYAIFSG